MAAAASVALVIAGLAGRDMYVSSSGNESLQVQLGNTCLTDAGVTLTASDAAAGERIVAAAESIPHAEAPIVERSVRGTPFSVAGSDLPAVAVLNLVDRQGQFAELGPGVRAPDDGEMLLPDWYLANGTVTIGDVVDVFAPRFAGRLNADGTFTPVDLGDAPIASLHVAGSYPEIPFRPEPSFWCGWREAIRPSLAGDRPAPLALVSPATMASMPAEAVVTLVEARPQPDRLRRDQARVLDDRLRSLSAVASPELTADELKSAANGDPYGSGLPTLIDRAGSAADFVSRTVAPAFIAAVLAALMLLIGAGGLVARDRRRELRLRALKGISGPGMAAGQLGWLVPTTLVGSFAGLAIAVVGVRALGPTPEIETAALRGGVIWGVIGWVAATMIVAAVIGSSGARLVDARQRNHRRWVLLLVPAVVVAAAVSFRRLDEFGGVRRSGVALLGGDLLAQAFVLLSSLAAIVVVTLICGAVLRRVRRFGGGLPVPIMLGWRRLTADPAIVVIVIATSALATSSAFQAKFLTTSVRQLLVDKASVFVGADLSIDVLGEPGDIAGLGASATVVSVLSVSGNPPVTILGVDRTTFADTAYWRDDAASVPLDELLGRLGEAAASGRVPALASGGTPATTDLPVSGGVLRIDVVGKASFFPSLANASVTAVVDRSALIGRRLVQTEVWIRDPEPDAASRLRQRGVRVISTSSATTVFENTDFLTTEWAYAAFTALGILIGAVALFAQVLVIEARSTSRRASRVLGRRMGISTLGEAVALGVEVGVPLFAGVGIGGAVGWLTAWPAITRLDPLRNLQPPAVLSVDLGVLVVAVVVAAVALVAVVGFGLVRTIRSDPMDSMRGSGG